VQGDKERERARDEEQVHAKGAVTQDPRRERRQPRDLLAGVHEDDTEQGKPAKGVDELEVPVLFQ